MTCLAETTPGDGIWVPASPTPEYVSEYAALVEIITRAQEPDDD